MLSTFAKDKTTDLQWVWGGLVAAGAEPLLVLSAAGVWQGVEVLYLGGGHVLMLEEGFFALLDRETADVPATARRSEYDHDRAVRDASVLTGVFAIVGDEDRGDHAWTWAATEAAARAALEELVADWEGFDDPDPTLWTAGECFERETDAPGRLYFEPDWDGGFHPVGMPL